jgi:predicted alpha/beta hydrolase family esterase
MNNVIIVHGMPDREEYYSAKGQTMSNSHFIPWLQKQLQIQDIKADAPEIPFAFMPDYQVWKVEFERFDITPETVLVGHSCGAGFLLRWLSEQKNTTVKKCILVAPWLNVENEHETMMFNFEIDSSLINRINLIVFESTNDNYFIQQSIKKIKTIFPNLKSKSFENKGHFCEVDIGKEFPELLVEIIETYA